MVDTNKLIQLCRQNDADMVGIFGSVARDEQGPESDLDILVRFSKRKSLFEIVRLERTLSQALGMKIDLLTEKAISPYLVENIRKDLKVLYEA